MNGILLAGFEGCDSSSAALLDKINCGCAKLLLPNNAKAAAAAITEALQKEIGVAIIIGQRPKICGKIAVEPAACLDGEKLRTRMDVSTVRRFLKEGGCCAYISCGCGNGLCNEVYYTALKSGVNCVFLHIPTMANIQDIEKTAAAVRNLIDNIAAVPALLSGGAL